MLPPQESSYLKGLHAHWGSSSLPVQAPWGGAWPPAQTSPLPILFLHAQVASLGQAIHLQLCSVRIPQASENALQAITLLARNHTPELVAAFLDFSISLDRCAALLPCLPRRPPSSLPQAEGTLLCPPAYPVTGTGLGVRGSTSLFIYCAPPGASPGEAPHSVPSLGDPIKHPAQSPPPIAWWRGARDPGCSQQDPCQHQTPHPSCSSGTLTLPLPPSGTAVPRPLSLETVLYL